MPIYGVVTSLFNDYFIIATIIYLFCMGLVYLYWKRRDINRREYFLLFFVGLAMVWLSPVLMKRLGSTMLVLVYTLVPLAAAIVSTQMSKDGKGTGTDSVTLPHSAGESPVMVMDPGISFSDMAAVNEAILYSEAAEETAVPELILGDKLETEAEISQPIETAAIPNVIEEEIEAAADLVVVAETEPKLTSQQVMVAEAAEVANDVLAEEFETSAESTEIEEAAEADSVEEEDLIEIESELLEEADGLAEPVEEPADFTMVAEIEPELTSQQVMVIEAAEAGDDDVLAEEFEASVESTEIVEAAEADSVEEEDLIEIESELLEEADGLAEPIEEPDDLTVVAEIEPELTSQQVMVIEAAEAADQELEPELSADMVVIAETIPDITEVESEQLEEVQEVELADQITISDNGEIVTVADNISVDDLMEETESEPIPEAAVIETEETAEETEISKEEFEEEEVETPVKSDDAEIEKTDLAAEFIMEADTEEIELVIENAPEPEHTFTEIVSADLPITDDDTYKEVVSEAEAAEIESDLDMAVVAHEPDVSPESVSEEPAVKDWTEDTMVDISDTADTAAEGMVIETYDLIDEPEVNIEEIDTDIDNSVSVQPEEIESPAASLTMIEETVVVEEERSTNLETMVPDNEEIAEEMPTDVIEVTIGSDNLLAAEVTDGQNEAIHFEQQQVDDITAEIRHNIAEGNKQDVEPELSRLDKEGIVTVPGEQKPVKSARQRMMEDKVNRLLEAGFNAKFASDWPEAINRFAEALKITDDASLRGMLVRDIVGMHLELADYQRAQQEYQAYLNGDITPDERKDITRELLRLRYMEQELASHGMPPVPYRKVPRLLQIKVEDMLNRIDISKQVEGSKKRK